MPLACDPVSQWMCDNAVCIDRRLRCDGKIDCIGDNSDELSCRKCSFIESFVCFMSHGYWMLILSNPGLGI